MSALDPGLTMDDPMTWRPPRLDAGRTKLACKRRGGLPLPGAALPPLPGARACLCHSGGRRNNLTKSKTIPTMTPVRMVKELQQDKPPPPASEPPASRPPSEAPTGAPTYTCALALDSWCGDAKAGGVSGECAACVNSQRAALMANGCSESSHSDLRTIVTYCPTAAPSMRPTLGPTKHADRVAVVPPAEHVEDAAREGAGGGATEAAKAAPSWASAASPCLAHIDLLCGDVQALVTGECSACVNGHRSELMEGGCAADSEMDLYQIVAYCATSSPTVAVSRQRVSHCGSRVVEQRTKAVASNAALHLRWSSPLPVASPTTSSPPFIASELFLCI